MKLSYLCIYKWWKQNITEYIEFKNIAKDPGIRLLLDQLLQMILCKFSVDKF